MNKKEKFETFLDSLKDQKHDTLIESIKKGFQACYEVGGMFYNSMKSPMGKSYSPYGRPNPSLHSYETRLNFPYKGIHDVDININFNWEASEKMTRDYPGTDEDVELINVIIMEDKPESFDAGDFEKIQPYFGKDIIDDLSEEQINDIKEEILTDENLYISERDMPERDE